MDGFARKMQLAELDYIRESRAAQQSLAQPAPGGCLSRTSSRGR
jgi:hypothetical protein